MNNIKILLPFLSLTFVFLINFLLIVFMHNSWNDSMKKYLPLQEEISTLKSDLSKSHLWLEEALAGDKTIDIQKDVLIPFENKAYRVYVDVAEKILIRQEDKIFLKQLQNLEQSLDSLLLLVKMRWTNSQEYGIGSKEDQKFDSVFNKILEAVNILSLEIKNKIHEEIANQHNYFNLTIILFLLINISIFVAFIMYIRKQKAYELSLFKSNEKNLVTLSSIGDAVVTTDVDGKVTFINTTAEKLIELSNPEVNGLHIDTVLDLYNMKTGEKIKTPIDDVLYNNLTKLISNGTLLKNKSNKEYIISDSASPLKTKDGEIFGTVLIFQDDTNRHKAREELNYQYTILHSVLNTTSDLIFYKDYLNKDGLYIGCNKAFEAFVGKSNEEIVNHTDTELFSKEVGDFFRTKDKDMLEKNETVINKEWVTYPDGSKVLLSTAKTPYINEEGKVLGVMGISRDITEKYKLDKEVESSHIMLSNLSKNVPGVLYQYKLSPDGHSSFPYSSNGVAEIYEVEPKDVVEDAQPVFNIIHPDDLSMVASSIQDSADTMNDWNLQYRVDLPKKGVRWLEGFSKPEKLEDGSILWHGYIHDITEKKHALELLKQKKHELETIIQEAPNPIMIHSEDGKVLMLNKVWEELTGYSYSEINTIEKWTEKAYGKEMPTIKKYIDNLYELNHAVDEGEYPIITNSGETIIWQFSSAPLGVIDGKRTVISSAMDITELKKKDEMMINQSRQAAMGDMIAMIAHQWRQPITVIGMEANNININILLEEEITTEELKKMADTISEQTQQLSQTIDDFRNFFKPNQDKVQTTVGSVLESTLKIVGKSMENNNIALIIENRSETEILTYPNQLLQVFLNLLGNAKDILLDKEVSDAKITIIIDETKDSIVTKICDNGGGIPKDAIKRLGEPYFTTKDKSTGTGLGLYMSITIVEKHLKGSLKWENMDEGACFIVTLPKE